MSTRQTSIEAYRNIKEKGLLSRRRFEVYSYVFNHGPISANEMCRDMLRQGLTFSSYNARFSELRDIGVLQEVGFKTDEITNQKVIVWDVTSALPIPYKKKEATNEEIALLREIRHSVSPVILGVDLVQKIDKLIGNTH